MAFTKFMLPVFLVGFLAAQVSCMVNTMCCQTTTETTVTETKMMATGSGAALAAAASGAYTYAHGLPTYPNGLSLNYFDNSGLPLTTMNYPYYNPYDHSFASELLNDYDFNVQMAAYSYDYNIPPSTLYSMYSLLYSLAPNMPTQNNLNTIQGIAAAYQAERLSYVNDYKRPALTDLYLDQVMNHLPATYPRPYRNLIGYLESRIPRMSRNTYESIYGSINESISPEYMGRVDYMAFAMETLLRYTNFSLTSWNIAN